MPYIRVTRAQFDPAAAEQIAGHTADLRRAIEGLPGLQHQHLGLDLQGGKGVAVSTFDTREHAQFEREMLGEIVARLQAAGMRMEAPEVYEVAS
jgi:hypothetical protein